MSSESAAGLRVRVAVAAFLAATTGTGLSCAPRTASGPELRSATAAQVLEEVRRPGARAVLVNVWATWCLPCREEFPDLLRVARELASQGLRVVLVSADFDDDREAQVRTFLADNGVEFLSFLKEGKDEEFINALEPRWSGAIPATLVYDADGKLQRIWEGSESYDTIRERVLEVIEHKNLEPKEEP